MPAIGVYYGETIRGRLPYQQEVVESDYPCDAALARHLIATLQHGGFDPSVMRSLTEGRREGHAFSFVHRFYLPDGVPIVPVFLNAYYPPNQPLPARCVALGEALRRAVEAFPGDARVGVMASGGLSHFVVDEALDRRVADALVKGDREVLRSVPVGALNAGSSEIRNWIVIGGAMEGIKNQWIEYQPLYRTPAGTGIGVGFGVWS
jgi:3-O-methylgallate 3,4-dioxygenase